MVGVGQPEHCSLGTLQQVHGPLRDATNLHSRNRNSTYGSKGSAHLCAIPQAPPLSAIIIPLVQAELQLKSKVPLKVAAMAQKEP